ncbi:SH3 domain-containing protein [Caldilinea sp.]|uniref:SH3 domain-containing protein n=1 Tax=Caldilinea sp. TaxID=2293560 RepID=UPI001B2607EE|nr:SH3 domain-containing protein [Caldilinea sp.]MBO9393849.1 SH3 domain-containing protein [Caldilinea sp.]
MQRKSLTLLIVAFSLLALLLLQMSVTQAAAQQQNATPASADEPVLFEQPIRIKIRQSIPFTISLLATSEVSPTNALTETEGLTPTVETLDAATTLTESALTLAPQAVETQVGETPTSVPPAEAETGATAAAEVTAAAELTPTETLTAPLLLSSVPVTLEIELDFVVTQTLTTTVPASVTLLLSDLQTQTVPISVVVAPLEAGSALVELVLPEELLPTPTITPTEELTPTETITPTAQTTPTVEAAPAVSGVSLIATSVIENANLRAGPGTNFAIVGQATAGQEVQVAAVSEDGGWYLLGNGAWIASFLVAAPEAPVPVVNDQILQAVTGQTAPAPTGVVTPTVTVDANLRAGPGTEFDVIGGTITGQAINIVGRNADGTWFRLDNGGWVFAALVANPPPLESVPVLNPDGTPAAAPQPPGLGSLLPTPTPTPTPTPQPQPQNEALETYFTAAIELIRQFDLVQSSLDGLLREVNTNNALLGDANWTTRMNAALALLRRTSASVGELAVPADAQTIHSQLEAAALSYTQAADALSAAIQRGSIAQIQEADTFISAAVSGLTAAETAILRARGQ